MSKSFTVLINENFIHELTVEAEDRDAAIDIAYKMLTDGMTPEEEEAADYSFEAEGYTGDVTVIPN
jgi:hypothetical protein